MDLLIFFALVLSLALPLALLRDVYDHDRHDRHDRINELNGHEPPRSHPRDDFSRTGSSWH